MQTSEIDTLAAETCAYMSQMHPDYSVLAARLAATNLQKSAADTFSGCVEQLAAAKVLLTTRKHADRLNAAVQAERDL